MRTVRQRLVGLVLGLLLGLALLNSGQAQTGPVVVVLTARGVINPAMAGYLARGISEAERLGATAVIIELDTPGGLDTSMREIMQTIINAHVPVVVYVSPQGARAASAGMFITVAAHVAAMAPSTNIGSAHPVTIGGPLPGGQDQPKPDPTMTEKVVNDAVALVRGVAARRGRNVEWVEKAVRESANVTEREALQLGVIDLVAEDLPALLRALDGRSVMLADGRVVTLRTATARVERLPMTWVEDLLHALSNPNIAYILLILGFYGLLYELANPGTWVPGVVGAIALVLGFYALGTLPVNYAGLALILLAFGLFLADVLITPGLGGLTAVGTIAFLLGSLLLTSGAGPLFTISPALVVAVTALTTLFFTLIIGAAARAQRRPVTTGREALIGAVGMATSDLAPEGMVHLQGELWSATAADGPIRRGQPVEVVAVEGLRLVVRPLPGPPLIKKAAEAGEKEAEAEKEA